MGDAFEIALEGVPTGGYSWEAMTDELQGVVELLGRVTRALGPAMVGGRVVQVFRFRCIAPGDGALLFRYGRRWEAAPVREHRVRVTVSEPPAAG